MKTKPYTELYELIAALCGVVFSPIEKPRVKAWVNRRARLAYNASLYWTRFLTIGEDRLVVDNNVIPYEEEGKNTIDTFLKITINKNGIYYSNFEIPYSVASTGAVTRDSFEDGTSLYVSYRKTLDDNYGDDVSNQNNIPIEWFYYIAHGTYADFLRGEQQNEKSQVADYEAERILEDELLKLYNQGVLANDFQRSTTYLSTL